MVLAGIGLFSMLYNDLLGTLKTAGMILVVAGIIYLVYRQVSKSISTNSFDSGYKKALQQQKRKQKGKTHSPFALKEQEKAKPKKVNKPKSAQRKNNSFQVIEGKKNKNEHTKTS